MKKIISVISFFLCAASYAQTAPGLDVKFNEDGFFGRSVKIEEVGGRAEALYLKGNNLYVGADYSAYVFDVSDPMKPRLRSKCGIYGNARQIVADDRAMFVSTRGGGVTIIDASDLDALKPVGRYDAVELATGIDVAGDVLFIGLRSYGVEFVDISDLSRPAHIYLQKTSECQSCWYQDGYLYSGDWAKGELTTISASDMSDIKILSIKKLQGFGDGICAFGDRIYAATGHNSTDPKLSKEEKVGLGHGVEIFDISDPADPKFVSRCQFDRWYRGGAGDWWTVRPSSDRRTLFVVDTDNGLYGVDISDETAPVIKGRIFIPNPKKPEVAATYLTSVAVGNGVVYASAQEYGVFAVECAAASEVTRDLGRLPSNVGARFEYTTAGDSRFNAWKPAERYQVRGVAASGDYLYAACSDAGLYILKRTRKGVVEQGKAVSGFVGDVCVRGNRAFLAQGMNGLGIYDIAKDGSLKEIARINDIMPNYPTVLWVWSLDENHVVVNDRHKGGILLDISRLPEWKFCLRQNQGTTWWDKYMCNTASPDGFALCPVIRKGTAWIDLNGKEPVMTFDRDSFKPASGASNFKDGTFITCQGNKMFQLRRGDDGRTELVETAKVLCKGNPLWDGKNLVATNFRHGKYVSLIDVTDFPQAGLLWKENTTGNPDRPIFWKDKLVVPCGYQGLLIEK